MALSASSAKTPVSIVIPAYNEEEVIGSILERLHQLEIADEIIVVDDGSGDHTSEVAVRYPSVRLIQHPYNIGNGAAVKSGIRAATGEIIVLMDADGQHPPEIVPKLLEYIEKYDMVVGARTTASEAQVHRNLANNLFNRYAAYVVGKPVPDLTSGFRVMRARVAKNFVYLLPNAFSYPTTLTIAFFRAGYAVKYVPFAAPARVGVSKIRPFRDGLRFLLTITRLAILFVPLKIFLPVSIALTSLGALYIAAILIEEHRFSGFGGLVSTIGLFTFLLGLVAEQIALLRLVNSER